MPRETVDVEDGDGRILLGTAFSLTIVAVSAVSLIAPALPELATDYGVTEAAMAWFQSAVLIPGLVAAPVAMRLTRSYGLRRVLVVSLLLYGLAGASHLIRAPFELAVLARGVQGIGGAALLAGGFALLGRLPGAQRAKGVSANAALMSTMMVLQPLFGSALAAWWLRAPFLFYLSAIVLAAVLMTRRSLIPDSSLPNTGRSWTLVTELRPILTATAALNAFIFGWMLYLSPLLLAQRFSYGVTARGAVLATQSIGSALAALAVRRHVAAGRERHLLVVAAGGVAVAALVAAAASVPAVAVVGLVFGGAAYGFANPAVLSVASQGREGATGWWQSSARAGQIVGPLAAAAILAALPMATAFRFALVPAAILLLVGIVGMRKVGVNGRSAASPQESSGLANP